jgi:hypothetical protein
MSVIIKLLSKFDDSGLKKAKSGFSGLTKTLGAVGIGFGIKQLTDGLLDAAKAAAADEKSTRLLNIQLVRNAGATKASLKENDAFIQSLSLATGIMDDDLRPTMAKFANVTGNVEDAQRLLRITLDGAAGSGKNQEKIANAVAKAYAGNTTALKKMFPELTKSKDVLGDFAATYAGLAEENADPFMKFNNSMDILKEKLGVVVLPVLLDFIDEISKPGGAIEVVGQFFDDLANPKTDAGQTFTEIKDAVGEVIESVKTFFGYFGDGDAVTGFKNIATSLISALPALLALKGIMVLAAGGKAIAGLIAAMTAIAGGGGGGSPIVAGGGKSKGKFPLLGGGALLSAGLVLSLSGDTANSGPQTPEEIAAWKAQDKINKAEAAKYYGKIPGLIGENKTNKLPSVFKPVAPVMKPVAPVMKPVATVPTTKTGSTLPTTNAEWKQFAINANARTQAGLNKRPTFAKPQTTSTVTNNITINVPNADPKAVVNTFAKYTKQNGTVPSFLVPPKKPAN